MCATVTIVMWQSITVKSSWYSWSWWLTAGSRVCAAHYPLNVAWQQQPGAPVPVQMVPSGVSFTFRLPSIIDCFCRSKVRHETSAGHLRLEGCRQPNLRPGCKVLAAVFFMVNAMWWRGAVIEAMLVAATLVHHNDPCSGRMRPNCPTSDAPPTLLVIIYRPNRTDCNQNGKAFTASSLSFLYSTVLYYICVGDVCVYVCKHAISLWATFKAKVIYHETVLLSSS